MINTQILLASRPEGEPSADNFRTVRSEVAPLADGQVLVRHHYLSLDPYMRGRMSDKKSYAPPQAIDAVMVGGTAGEVVESRSERFAAGDLVVGMGGWQEYSVVDSSKPGTLRKVDVSHVPLSAYLGAVGMPGVTAWYGLFKIIAPKPGNTVVVSAASGAVGSVVGQLAKIGGCRAVGIAGGAEKCGYVTRELKFDACIDYKSEDVGQRLKEVAPDGVDGYFENVGGEIMEAVFARINLRARIALCGLISGYNEDDPPSGPRSFGNLLIKRARLQGFIVLDHFGDAPQAAAEIGELLADGRIEALETVVEGFEKLPDALNMLFDGANTGKLSVKVG